MVVVVSVIMSVVNLKVNKSEVVFTNTNHN